MTDKLPDADWLTAATTQKVIAALEAAKPHGSRFVGGCVRNTLMGRDVDDIDLATQLEPDQVIAALEAAGIRTIPTGIEHGTVTAVVDHAPFEITSLRRDVETYGRRAVVAFTEDWSEDAMRRDFRLNALYAEPDGTLHDPTGGGIEDAEAGKVIFIGDADTRLREDYLRILRFFRFNAWYGAGIDADGLSACDRQKVGLSRIAVERIWKELKKILAAPDPRGVLTAMVRIGLMEDVFRAVDGVSVLSPLLYMEREARLDSDPLRRLMAFLPKNVDIVASIAAGLKLSNLEKERLRNWAAADTAFVSDLGGPGLRSALYHLGEETVIDAVLLTAAGAGGPDIEVALAGLAEARGWQPVRFPLAGQDLINAGLKPGPMVGQLLEELETVWIKSDFRMGKSELLALLQEELKRD
ncbi:MAG: CCA tRNA nucleotidyltransferase [Pseudomonadota bacterium]